MKELALTIVLAVAATPAAGQELDRIHLEHRSLSTGTPLPVELISGARMWTEPASLALPLPTSLLLDATHYEFACTVGDYRTRTGQEASGGVTDAFGVFRSRARADAVLRLPNQIGKGHTRSFTAWYEHDRFLPPALLGQPRVTVYAFGLDENEPLFWLGVGLHSSPFSTTPPDVLQPRTMRQLFSPPQLFPTESAVTGPLAPFGYGWAASTADGEVAVAAHEVLAMPQPQWAPFAFELRFQGWIRLENGLTHQILPTPHFIPVETFDGPNGADVGTRVEFVVPLEQTAARGATVTLIALYQWEPGLIITIPPDPGPGDRDPTFETDPIALRLATNHAAILGLLRDTELLYADLRDALAIALRRINGIDPR